MSGLFQWGEFALASGAHSPWKIDCDALSVGDLTALAALAATRLPYRFTRVEGVPRGGLAFAEALRRHTVASTAPVVLLVNDVWTTGESMRRFQASLGLGKPPLGVPVRGLVIFARAVPPPWVTALFTAAEMLR